MIKKLILTEDHLKLINVIRFHNNRKDNVIFVNKTNPYLLDGKLEDLAFVLGLSKYKIASTEDDAEGAAFPDEQEKYMLDIHHYIVDNLYDIEVLIHQMVLKGGITPGTYKCIDSEEIWEKDEDINED